MERKSVNVAVGLTQAERVYGPAKSRLFESATTILSSMPSKYTALPVIPAAHCGPLTRVPVFPLPEESFAVVPDPSSKFQ